MPIFWHTVTAAEAEKGTFGSAKAGDVINTTNTNLANRYEMAAASILVNCVNPRYPAWNKIIANGYFDLDEPSPEDASLEKCSKLYEDFEDKMYVYMNSPEGGALIKAFDAKFPNAEISNVSKVAIILWQGEI